MTFGPHKWDPYNIFSAFKIVSVCSDLVFSVFIKILRSGMSPLYLDIYCEIPDLKITMSISGGFIRAYFKIVIIYNTTYKIVYLEDVINLIVAR